MITLAHLSDIHLAPLPPVRLRELANKRLTGYANWRLRRRASMDGLGLAALVAHLHAQEPDFTCVTGDLVNLGLDAEIAIALGWLKGIGPPEKVCVAPGNHDAYLPGTLKRAHAAWQAYVSGETLDDNPFPFVRRIGEVAVIACSSAVATPPWIAAGYFGAAQAERLARLLQQLGEDGYFRVVMIHHPPSLEGRSYHKGLWGGGRFRAAVARHGAELVLHGHTHRSTIHHIAGPTGDVPVVGVAAAGTTQEGGRPHRHPARYNLFHIERAGPRWSCTMQEYGFQSLGTEVVLRLDLRLY
jgi:3',5'-cyclic AMP phosphodiesterase CpdA